MTLSRRRFLTHASTISIISIPGIAGIPLPALGIGSRKSIPQYQGENLFLAFNAIREVEVGESDEYTTIANIERILTELKVPVGTQIIGIGARSGTAQDPFGAPGEMGYLWTFGSPWNGFVTSIRDASPVPLAKDDPIPVTQIGVFDPASAHHFEYNDTAKRGSVLWTLFEDETIRTGTGTGFHNAFRDLDGGMTETIYNYSRAARRNPQGWATDRDRAKLQHFIPDLDDDTVWKNFAATLGAPLILSEWQKYIKQQGWDGAAVVLKGEMANVLQFHLREWNQKSPNEPSIEFGKGTHLPPANLKFGRELKQYMTRPANDWTMVGFIWNLESENSEPAMSEWMRFSDLFGQPFHIHGFSASGNIGGHTLMPLMGAGALSVDLYPLSFKKNATAFMLNNDLALIEKSLKVSDTKVSVDIINHGENFARNVKCTLRRGLFSSSSNVIPALGPRQRFNIEFLMGDRRGRYTITIDSPKNFFEGGAGKTNNSLSF